MSSKPIATNSSFTSSRNALYACFFPKNIFGTCASTSYLLKLAFFQLPDFTIAGVSRPIRCSPLTAEETFFPKSVIVKSRIVFSTFFTMPRFLSSSNTDFSSSFRLLSSISSSAPRCCSKISSAVFCVKICCETSFTLPVSNSTVPCFFQWPRENWTSCLFSFADAAISSRYFGESFMARRNFLSGRPSSAYCWPNFSKAANVCAVSFVSISPLFCNHRHARETALWFRKDFFVKSSELCGDFARVLSTTISASCNVSASLSTLVTIACSSALLFITLTRRASSNGRVNGMENPQSSAHCGAERSGFFITFCFCIWWVG